MSNASMLERLSCNIFITNFPTYFSSKDLWNTCSKFGTILDVYIPNKVSKQGKVYVVRAKEATGWVPDFGEKNSDESEDYSDNNSVGKKNWVESEEGEIIPEFVQNDAFINNIAESEPINGDARKNQSVSHEMNDSNPKFPPGFTPRQLDHYEYEKVEALRESTNPQDSKKETKMVSLDVFVVKNLWGNMLFDFATSSARGRSRGTWLANNVDLLFISVYSPQELSLKRVLWNYMLETLNRWQGEVIIIGDFNEVRFASKHHGSYFHSLNAAEFNMFITSSQLIDIPLGGYSFTWSNKHESKMSKLDWFLVSQGMLDLFPNLTGLILHRHLSDHRPILLKETHVDYGPTSFRLYHSWFLEDDFHSVIENSWNNDAPAWDRSLFDVNFPMRLNSNQVFDLEDMVSNEEIKKVVWDCGSDKSPRPDGFTFEYFKKFWTIVGGDEKFKRLFNLELQKDANVASKLQASNVASSFRRPPRSGIENSQFIELGQILSSISLSSASDRRSWTLHGLGDFLVKSSREVIDKHVLVVSPSQNRWSKVLPIKLNVFSWRMMHDRLPTRWWNIHIPIFDDPSSWDSWLNARLIGRWWNIHIPIFDDPSSWDSWLNGCDAALETLPADIEAGEKAALMKKTYNTLILCLGDRVLREVTKETTAAGI
nr:RNA-directed DNA polymerase, eukaryota [Tanacetum cinerariifolium]